MAEELKKPEEWLAQKRFQRYRIVDKKTWAETWDVPINVWQFQRMLMLCRLDIGEVEE